MPYVRIGCGANRSVPCSMQLLEAGIGLFQHDLGKYAGSPFIAVLQFFVVHLPQRSARITPQIKRG
jgi:hypothetical protein